MEKILNVKDLLGVSPGGSLFSEIFEQALKEGIEFFGFKLGFDPESGWIYLKERLKIC